MASSAFLVDDPPGNTIAAPTAPTAPTGPSAHVPAPTPASGDPSSTPHRFAGAYAFNPPLPVPGRKRGYSGSGPSEVPAADRPSPDHPESSLSASAGHDAGSPAVDTPGSNDGLAAAGKKRKTVRGSRGVANLTPEQLDRKRANGESPETSIKLDSTLTLTVQTAKPSAPSANASV